MTVAYEPEMTICQDCGERYDADSEGFTFNCAKCGRTTCENCASSGLCFSCDCDAMAGDDE